VDVLKLVQDGVQRNLKVLGLQEPTFDLEAARRSLTPSDRPIVHNMLFEQNVAKGMDVHAAGRQADIDAARLYQGG
jgi:hypothetical protein